MAFGKTADLGSLPKFSIGEEGDQQDRAAWNKTESEVKRTDGGRDRQSRNQILHFLALFGRVVPWNFAAALMQQSIYH